MEQHVFTETEGERNGRLHAELGEISRRLAEIQRELNEPGAGERSAEERRRDFRVIAGGAVAGVAVTTALAAWARAHGKTAAGYLLSTAGGAALTAAVTVGPASALCTSPQPHKVPTASAAPAPTGQARPRRTPGLAPAVISSVRRRASTPQPDETSRSTPPQGPSYPVILCVVTVRVPPRNPILAVCL